MLVNVLQLLPSIYKI